jgi:hypothetical protein
VKVAINDLQVMCSSGLRWLVADVVLTFMGLGALNKMVWITPGTHHHLIHVLC